MDHVEIAVSGRKYRFRRFPRDQLVMVVARLLPMLAFTGEELEAAGAAGALKVFYAIPPADWDSVLSTTFRDLEREAAPDRWVPVWCAEDGTLAFEDIGICERIQIVMEIVQASEDPYPALIDAVPVAPGNVTLN